MSSMDREPLPCQSEFDYFQPATGLDLEKDEWLLLALTPSGIIPDKVWLARANDLLQACDASERRRAEGGNNIRFKNFEPTRPQREAFYSAFGMMEEGHPLHEALINAAIPRKNRLPSPGNFVAAMRILEELFPEPADFLNVIQEHPPLLGVSPEKYGAAYGVIEERQNQDEITFAEVLWLSPATVTAGAVEGFPERLNEKLKSRLFDKKKEKKGMPSKPPRPLPYSPAVKADPIPEVTGIQGEYAGLPPEGMLQSIANITGCSVAEILEQYPGIRSWPELGKIVEILSAKLEASKDPVLPSLVGRLALLAGRVRREAL